MMNSHALLQNCREVRGNYDLAVVGAGSAGIGAAISAARKKLRVILIESYGFPGGVGTKSCTPLFFGFGVNGKQTTAGISEEFIRRMDEIGQASLILNDGCAMPEYRKINGRPLDAKIQLHPEAMKLVYDRMLREAGVECLYYTQMVDAAADNNRIVSVLVNCLEGPVVIKADYFIDATGDALLIRAADGGVRKYAPDETMHKSMFFMVGGVTPFDHEHNMRIYKEAYEGGRLPEHVWSNFGYSVQLNPGVVQIAVCYAVGDGVDSGDMTRMGMELRESIQKMLAFLKEEMPGFDRCYLLETAGYIGVRAGQGIIGRETFSEEMVLSDSLVANPVALTSRNYGAHGNNGKFMADWSRNKKGVSAVPMGALVSDRLENALAAGRCISAEARIIGTFRMMNTCMTMGEAAGLITAIAAGKGIPTSQVGYEDLHSQLVKAGFILE